MKRTLTALLLVASATAALAANAPAPQGDQFGQPQSERAAQQALPQSPDEIWKTLQHTVITQDAKQGIYAAKHPPEVLALVGKTLIVHGFMLPYTTDMLARHFLLTRYTPVCYFCPPGAPNEVIDVTVATPVKWEDKLYAVSGTFAVQNNGEKGLFFRLDDARIIEPVSLDAHGLPKASIRGR